MTQNRQTDRACCHLVCLLTSCLAGSVAGRTCADEPASATLTLQRTLSHYNAVYWAAFSRDGKIIATASLDNTVKLWTVADGRHVGTLKGHGDGVAFVGFLSDGAIVTASLDRTLKVWSADGGAKHTLSGHQDYLTCAAVAANGALLASGGFDKTVRLWDADTGAAVATLSGHTGKVQAVAISPSARIVASGGDDRSIRLWDVPAKKLLRILDGHKRTVDALAFAPRNELLASAGADGVRLWSFDGKQIASIDSAGIKSLAFSPNGQEVLATGGTDGAFRLFRVGDRRELSMTAAHKNSVYCVAFNPAGTLLASAGFDGAIHIWQVRGK
jgi:WD40 repeat protein